MLKLGMKRRRTKAECDADREEARLREESLRTSDEQKQQLKDRVAQLEQTNRNNQSAAEILNNLLAQGVCVQAADGSISIPSASKQRPGCK